MREGGCKSGVVLIEVTDAATGTTSVSQEVAAGQTVSTGVEPTADEPAQVAVTTPNGGTVTIAQNPSVPDPAGYLVMGAQFTIEAPTASALDPLRLVFQFDESQLPAGEDAESVTVFRDGVLITPCADTSGTAHPDPCVASRVAANGAVVLTVLSSHASAWTLAVRIDETTTVLAPVDTSTYGQPITLTANVTTDGGGVPTGTSTFKDTSQTPATTLGSAQLNSVGTAKLPGVVLGAGDHQLVAVYLGNETAASSTSAPRLARVTKAPVVIVAQPVSVLGSVLGGGFRFVAVVKSGVTGAPVVGATVRFKGTSVLNLFTLSCSTTTDSQGVAKCNGGSLSWLLVSLLRGTFDVTSAPLANYLGGEGVGRFT